MQKETQNETLESVLQKQLGIFYTHRNIFKSVAFIKWFNQIPKEKKENILEPFAGSNGIINLLDKLGYADKYSSFDVMPRSEAVVYKDTLIDFPKGFTIAVTNPPFLAKNSAKRRGFEIDFGQYNDMYEICMAKCLDNVEYLAIIIPESFITNKEFDKSRLFAVISLAEKRIFKDTEHPVCLALFNPNKTNDYEIYFNDDLVGTYSDMLNIENEFIQNLTGENSLYEINWHHKQGQIGFTTIDATDRKKKIKFFLGEQIDEKDVNHASRLRTRIFITNKKTGKPIKINEAKRLIKFLNEELDEYREVTSDVFLTAFKGLRDDGKYRRRIDFTKARLIVDSALLKYSKIMDNVE